MGYLGACADYLASEAGGYVTGVTIPEDGGFLYNGAWQFRRQITSRATVIFDSARERLPNHH